MVPMIFQENFYLHWESAAMRKNPVLCKKVRQTHLSTTIIEVKEI